MELKVLRVLAVLIIALAFLTPQLLRAQDPSSPAPTQPSGSDQQDPNKPQTGEKPADASANSPDQAPKPVANVTEAPPILRQGGAGALQPDSPLRWGSFSVGSIEMIQVVDEISSSNGIPGVQNIATLFQAFLIYDRTFRDGRLAFQYTPRLVISNGNLFGDYKNQDVSVDTYFQLTPRLILTLDNRFVYTNSQSQFGDFFLDASSVTSTTVQNTFLDTTTTRLSDSTGVGFHYAVSDRTGVNITPNFSYIRLDGTTINPLYKSSLSYGVNTSFSHLLGERTVIGGYYNHITSQFVNAAPDSSYNQMGVSAGHQLTQTWYLGGSVGATSSNFAGRPTDLWSVAARASVVKSFTSSVIALSYDRGETVTGYVGNGLTERYDLHYRNQLTNRLHVGVGAGYQREIGNSTGIRGEYVTGEMNYRLLESLSLFANYVHKLQHSSTSDIFSGHRDLVAVGINWNPSAGQTY